MQGWTLTETVHTSPLLAALSEDAARKAGAEAVLRAPRAAPRASLRESATGPGARGPGGWAVTRRPAERPQVHARQEPASSLKERQPGIKRGVRHGRCLGVRPRSEPSLPAVLGLWGPAVIRDHLRPQGPALPQPIRLAHGTSGTATRGPRRPPPTRRTEVTQKAPPPPGERGSDESPAPSGRQGGRGCEALPGKVAPAHFAASGLWGQGSSVLDPGPSRPVRPRRGAHAGRRDVAPTRGLFLNRWGYGKRAAAHVRLCDCQAYVRQFVRVWTELSPE